MNIREKFVNFYNWHVEDATTCETLYKNYLYLNKKYGGKYKIPPSEEIDLFWHEHILDTHRYIFDCDNIFGEYFHHNPLSKKDCSSKKELEKLFQITQKLYFKEFGEYL